MKVVAKFEKIFLILFPNHKEIIETKNEIQNKITFPIYDMVVFLIPYVIPIPRESILLDIAKNSELSNIKISSLGYNMSKNGKMIKYSIGNKISTSHILLNRKNAKLRRR